jgi:hypothetical protein
LTESDIQNKRKNYLKANHPSGKICKGNIIYSILTDPIQPKISAGNVQIACSYQDVFKSYI